MNSEKRVDQTPELVAVLQRIKFKSSCINLNWKWAYEHVFNDSGEIRGWLIRATYAHMGSDGVVSVHDGRREFIHKGSSESYVVRTCLLLSKLAVESEIEYAFQIDEQAIFSPERPLAGPLKATASTESIQHQLRCFFADRGFEIEEDTIDEMLGLAEWPWCDDGADFDPKYHEHIEKDDDGCTVRIRPAFLNPNCDSSTRFECPNCSELYEMPDALCGSEHCQNCHENGSCDCDRDDGEADDSDE